VLEADAQRCFLKGDNRAVRLWAFPSSASSVAAGVFSPRPMKNVTSRTKRIMHVLTTTTVTINVSVSQVILSLMPIFKFGIRLSKPSTSGATL
jgi:hypothetical protein